MVSAMTTLITPTLHRQLLRTVGEAVAKDHLGEPVRLGVGVVREIRESCARGHQEFEDSLAKGMEAKSFVDSFGPALSLADEYLLQLRRLLEELAGAEETPAREFIAELRRHEEEESAFRARLAEALALASQPPRKLDWDRLKAESDNEFAAGRFTTFETPEDLFTGPTNGD